MTCSCNEQPRPQSPQRKGVVTFCDLCDPCNEAASNVRLCAFVVPTLEDGRYFRNSFVFVQEDDSVYYIDDRRSEIPFGSRPKFIDHFDPEDAANAFKSTTVYDLANGKAYVYGPDGTMMQISMTASVISDIQAGDGILIEKEGGVYTISADMTEVASAEGLQTVTLLATNHTGQITALNSAVADIQEDIEDMDEELTHVHGVADEASATATLARTEAQEASQAASEALALAATKQDELTPGENITIVNNVISASAGGGTTDPATPTSNGLMTSVDRTKLKTLGYYSGASVASDDEEVTLSFVKNKSNDNGSTYTQTTEDVTIGLVDDNAAGLMSPEDKGKLDSINLNNLQTKLYAGYGIELNGNTISAAQPLQTTGQSEDDPMSQKAITDAINDVQDSVPVVTYTTTDPGEGATLAANHFIVVHGA